MSVIVSGTLFLALPPFRQPDDSMYAISQISSTLLLPDLFFVLYKHKIIDEALILHSVVPTIFDGISRKKIK